jgi:hypothetical protein
MTVFVLANSNKVSTVTSKSTTGFSQQRQDQARIETEWTVRTQWQATMMNPAWGRDLLERLR